MLKNIAVLILVITLAGAGITGGAALHTARAQDGPNAWTAYDLKLRAGPGTEHAELAVLPAGTGLVLQARNADTSWVLGTTADGAQRGWLAALYLSFAEGFGAWRLPVSGEIVNAGAPAAPAAESAPSGDAAPAAPAVPGAVTATSPYALNVRAGAGTGHGTVGQLPGGAAVTLEARNGDASWVLGTQQGGNLRGWMAAWYLKFTNGSAWDLPVSDEVVNQPGAPVDGGQSAAPADVSAFTGQSVPAHILARAYEIHMHGRSIGINPNVFTTIGDSTTAGNQFTLPAFHAFGTGRYNLGNYGYLYPTISWFAGSFGVTSQASRSGYSSNNVLESAMANPGVCGVGETPLACEIRLRRPAVAVIYIGFGDLAFSTPESFHNSLDQIVGFCISQGVIPVLTTLTASEALLAESGYGPNLDQINNSIRAIAGGYSVPLIDLYAAAHGLPNQGTVVGEGVHLSFNVDGVINFNGDERLYGKDLRELLTLQVLNDLRANVLAK